MKIYREVDYQELLKKVHKANQRIIRLTEKYGERSWATVSLYNKLEDPKILGLTRYGNIKVNRKMSDIKLKYIEKVTDEFLESQTSRIRGAEEAIKKTKEKLRATYSDSEKLKFISDEEVGKLYNIVEKKEWRDYTQLFDPSETWARLVRAKETNLSLNEFEDLFKKDLGLNKGDEIKDLDVREYLREIYNMYVA